MAAAGEGEDTAALRLLHKLPALYGSRFFDILLLDACTPGAGAQLADRIGWDLVISLKQNQRELYQSAVRLFARRPADSRGTERHDGKQYQFQIWDSAGFPFSAITPSRYGSCDRGRPRRTITAGANCNRNHRARMALDYDFRCQAFPARWCAGSAMTAGNWRTMAGMI